MTDYTHSYDWPIACLSCGKSDSDDLTSRQIKLFGGQTSEKIGPKNYRTHSHYALGVTHICHSCYEEAKMREDDYIPKLKRLSNMLMVIGIILLPVSFVLYMLIQVYPVAIIMAISLFMMVIFCTFGFSGTEAGDEFKRSGWASFYINYKYKEGLTGIKEIFKFSSEDYAGIFQFSNPNTTVKVGTTYRFLPLKKPDWITCCIGLIPLLIFFFVIGLLAG